MSNLVVHLISSPLCTIKRSTSTTNSVSPSTELAGRSRAPTDRCSKASGLTYPQYLAMLVLWHAEGPVGVNDIGTRLHLDSGTLTPLLRRLEDAGFITRAWSNDDERRRIISLTEGGRSLRHQAAGLPERMLAPYPTPPQELAQVKAFLDDLATQLE